MYVTGNKQYTSIYNLVADNTVIKEMPLSNILVYYLSPTYLDRRLQVHDV